MKTNIRIEEVPTYSACFGVGKLCDIPELTLFNWLKVEMQWRAVQMEMSDYYYAGEQVVEDSSSVTPQMPLAASIRESNPEKLPEVEKV